MTYHAGIGYGMEQFGLAPREPHITCDGCGLVRSVTDRHGMPCTWFLNYKAAPGWKLKRTEHDDGNVTRVDHCPSCKSAERSRGAKP